MNFQPDYRHFEQLMRNERPARLPLYEHIISPRIMESVLDARFADLFNGDARDQQEYFRHYCRFFREMSYDVVSFEMCINDAMPGSGAICGGKAGPIQNRADFEAYPWADIPRNYWQRAQPRFDALVENLPAGTKAVGGVGNGVFEISEDLVGLEYLPFMQADDPELYRDLYRRIGDLMAVIWETFLRKYQDHFIAPRFGDDLGFRTSLLTNPRTVRDHILPQYKRIIDLIHSHGRPFLWHSCGCIFEVMEDIIHLGINAKHSNEDNIAPFSQWIERYGDRIALLGGFDMDFLCQKTPEEIFDQVVELGGQYRRMARGYALGSGNSITDYMPVENYLAMVRGAHKIREGEVEK